MPKSALVTGGGAGIGAATAIRLAESGYNVTVRKLEGAKKSSKKRSAFFSTSSTSKQTKNPKKVSDIDADAAERVASSLRSRGLNAASARCDVRDNAAQRRLFAEHASRNGGLPPDFVFLNAGVIDRVALLDDAEGKWQATLDIDLRSVIVGVTIAAGEAEREKKKKKRMNEEGVENPSSASASNSSSSSSSSSMSIVVVASAGGLYPMPSAPVYAAAKGGLVHFVRSAAKGIFERTGARLTALCPEQVDTALVAGVAAAGLLPGGGKALARLLTVDDVADAAVALGEDAKAVGTALMVHVSGALLEAEMPRKFLSDTGGRFSLKRPSSVPSPSPFPGSAAAAAGAAWARGLQPASNRAVVVQRPGTDFRAATEVIPRPIHGARIPPPPPPEGFLLVRRTFAGVNASDVNYAAGRYAAAPGASGGGEGSTSTSIPGTKGASPPFPCGFEAVGVVAESSSPLFKPGDAVAELCYDGFAELSLARADRCFKIARPDAAAVALLTSGLTASIGLEVACKPRGGEVIVVTAAAGGTGQFVVQLAAAAGCRVVATCGGPEKAEMLKDLGAERVIDYKSEDVAAVLKKEFPEVRRTERERERGRKREEEREREEKRRKENETLTRKN